jgi:mannose/fructose/N-acetylgalactosamine-specific phosphotransferase system component IIC
MQLWQALLIGLFAYLGRNQVPWLFGTTGGWYGMGRPLVAGAIIGLIMGDVSTGVLCGVAVQALYIGQIVPGGALPSDLNYAAFIGIPLAMAAGGEPEIAVALAMPLGTLGVAMHNLTMTFNSVFAHRADKYATEGDADKIPLMNLMGTVVHLVERVGIVTLVCFFGAQFASNVIASLPPVVMSFLAVGGKMLPALGFALLLKQIVSNKWMVVLFMLGWVLNATIPMTTTTLVIIAVALALIFVMGKGSAPAAAAANTNQVLTEEGDYDE